jgi:hypothetical protein
VSIREKAVNAVIEPISGWSFIVGRVPGSKRKRPDKKEAQPLANEQGREQAIVERLGQHLFA